MASGSRCPIASSGLSIHRLTKHASLSQGNLQREHALKISILGLGYVGTVSAACLAADGHSVIGVDPVHDKVDLINRGLSTIVEAEIGEFIRETVEKGNLRATQDSTEAIHQTELSFVCVGTPSRPNGDLDLRYIRRICEQIGQALRTKNGWHTVVIRSTILPGTIRNVIIPTLEEFSGKSAGKDFGICYNPEFLREGSAVKDFRYPPKTVLGQLDQASGDLVATIYEGLEAPLIRTD